VGGQDDDEDVTQEAHPEVLGVHVQLVTVEFAQLSKTFLDVVQVLDGFPEGGEHFLAMGADHGVARDGGGAGEVPEGSEEPLGPGRDLPGQGLGTALGHVDLAPEAGDELLLLGCPVHHGVEREVLPGVSLNSDEEVELQSPHAQEELPAWLWAPSAAEAPRAGG
uniref:Uncharacterized protein n=1 Tax=Athene cunicularia TaxID=194338 RepID=A0A663M2F3_ATHCN